MEQKKIRNLGTISYDTKWCNLKTVDNVTIPRSQYNKLYGMAILAMMAGGPLAMTSCTDPYTDSLQEVFIPKAPKSADSTYVVPIGANAENTADDEPRVMFDYLGIPAIMTCSDVSPSEAIKEGTVIEFAYHEDVENLDYKLKINEELSTKDSLVFDGTRKDPSSGIIAYIRQTYTKTIGGSEVKYEMTKRGKPISENSGWNVVITNKYIPAPDGVKEYDVFSDGTEIYRAKNVSHSDTSVSRVLEDGYIQNITNVTLYKYHNVNTGLHDVHM